MRIELQWSATPNTATPDQGGPYPATMVDPDAHYTLPDLPNEVAAPPADGTFNLEVSWGGEQIVGPPYLASPQPRT